MALTPNQRKQAQVNALKDLIAKQLQNTQQKPDWITDEQWKAVPSISWWEDRKQGAEYIKQSKPLTTQEVKDQFSRLRNERNWKQGE